MSRAYAIWVVTQDAEPIAGFTVKHEMITWLRRRSDVAELLIYRVPDGFPDKSRVEYYRAVEFL